MKKLLSHVDGVSVLLTLLVSVFVAGMTTQTLLANIGSSSREIDEQVVSLVVANISNQIKTNPDNIDIDVIVRTRDLCSMMIDTSESSRYIDSVYNYDSIKTNCAIIEQYNVVEANLRRYNNETNTN